MTFLWCNLSKGVHFFPLLKKEELFCVFAHSDPMLLETKNGNDFQTITALPQYMKNRLNVHRHWQIEAEIAHKKKKNFEL